MRVKKTDLYRFLDLLYYCIFLLMKQQKINNLCFIFYFIRLLLIKIDQFLNILM